MEGSSHILVYFVGNSINGGKMKIKKKKKGTRYFIITYMVQFDSGQQSVCSKDVRIFGYGRLLVNIPKFKNGQMGEVSNITNIIISSISESSKPYNYDKAEDIWGDA